MGSWPWNLNLHQNHWLVLNCLAGATSETFKEMKYNCYYHSPFLPQINTLYGCGRLMVVSLIPVSTSLPAPSGKEKIPKQTRRKKKKRAKTSLHSGFYRLSGHAENLSTKGHWQSGLKGVMRKPTPTNHCNIFPPKEKD